MRTLLFLVAVAAIACDSPKNQPADAAGGDTPVVDATADARTCVATPAGLRARYRAENNAEDHGDKFDGNIVGATFGPGKYGLAFEFNGSNAIAVDDAGLLWPAFSLTVEAWIRGTSQSGGGLPLVCKLGCARASCSDGAYFCLRLEGDRPVFDLRSDEATNIASITASSSPVLDGQWHHLVAVRDGVAKTTSLYVDGLLAIAASPELVFFGPMTETNVDPLVIGARATFDPNIWYPTFRGAIDEVAIYHQALTAAEVTAIYNAPDGKCL